MLKRKNYLTLIALGLSAGVLATASAADLRPGMNLSAYEAEEDAGGEETNEGTSAVGSPMKPEAQALLDGALRDFETDAYEAREGDQTDEDIINSQEEAIRDTLDWLERSGRDSNELNTLSELFTEEQGTAYGIMKRPVRRPGRPKMSGLTCLAVGIEGEAGGESEAGKRAVAITIMRRAKGNPGRVCAVIFASHQFESIGRRLPRPSASSMRVAMSVIKSGVGKTCTWDHFIAKSLQRRLGRKIPAWVRDFERRGCAHKRIGNQDYYASCNCKRSA